MKREQLLELEAQILEVVGTAGRDGLQAVALLVQARSICMRMQDRPGVGRDELVALVKQIDRLLRLPQ